MIRTVSALSAAVIVLGLVGCSSSESDTDASASPSASALACADTQSGSESESISVKGKTNGKLPEVSFDAPFKATKTERTVTVKGDGEETKAGDQLDIALALYSASTGKLITSNGFDDDDPVSVTMNDTYYLPGLVRAAECLTVGSRAVLTGTVTDLLGSSADPTTYGLAATDTSVVFLVDVIGISQTQAEGKPQTAPANLPTVKDDPETGEPTVTIPTDLAKPTETTVGVIKKGDGKKVKAGDKVTLQYKGIIWDTGTVFDSSWTTGPTSFDITQTITGFQKALEGQTVNSQIIVAIPPADGYGDDGNSNAGISGDDTLVFVIDILDTESTSSDE